MNKSNIVSAIVYVLILTVSARANLLVDPGYESNPLTTSFNVLGNFPVYQGVWGVEAATIVGAENGITPPEGIKMLRNFDNIMVGTNQSMQVTDITAYAGAVDSGSASVYLSALFNVEQSVPAAIAAVHISFFTTSNYGSFVSTTSNGTTLDTNPGSWQPIALGTSIPIGTRWLLSQVVYDNASLIGNDGAIHPGYVDIAELRVVPEPATIGLLATGAAALVRKRKH